ncbi:putative quinol monooxygenase [Muriicola sp. SD30]|uniref:putative quinol monooxygenase n=1 Tax=Muriicola sp. SD30 TaxID=3240936 RepID=UPI00350E95B4
MKVLKSSLILMFLCLPIISCIGESKTKNVDTDPQDAMIRIAEIDIDSVYLDEYLDILREESEASVRLEPGVICIYPMFQKENPTQIRLLEIYANKKAYESHLQTPHFKLYKESTLHMVKSLRLIDVEAIDPETMPAIFKKFNY